MTASPAVIKLLAALRQSSLEGVPAPDALPNATPVAFVLQPTDASGPPAQHPYDSLRAALAQRRNGTLRKLAHELGFEDKDAGALSDLLHDRYEHVSLKTANRWARALGLPPIPPLYEVAGCPSCGSVHVAGDCHGEPFESIIFLHRSALFHVKHAAPRKPDTRATLHIAPELRDRINAQRGEMSQAEYIAWLLDEYAWLEKLRRED